MCCVMIRDTAYADLVPAYDGANRPMRYQQGALHSSRQDHTDSRFLELADQDQLKILSDDS